MEKSENITCDAKGPDECGLSSTSEKILLVDDNHELLGAISLVLESHGLLVETASSVENAFSLLEKFHPDLIISDVMMEGMDGFEFQEKVKETPSLCSLPFIFLSAVSDPTEIRKGKLAGCDDYLLKPFHPDDLIAAVRGKLSTFKARRKVGEDYLKDVIERLSHEFRTPLVSINTGAEILKDKLQDSDDTSLVKLSQTVFKGGERLKRLIEDFSSFQDIQSGKAKELYQKHKEQVDLKEFVAELVIEARDFKLPEEAKINLKVDETIEKPEATLGLFKLQIKNIFYRLLDNAFKFAGHEKPVDVIVLQKDKQTISFVIRDYGPGLGSKDYPDAYKLFGQIGRDTKEQQGVGFGISICSYLAEINGANIFLNEPESGEGLEVEVRFSL